VNFDPTLVAIAAKVAPSNHQIKGSQAKLLLGGGPPVTTAAAEVVPGAKTPPEGAFTIATHQLNYVVISSNMWTIFRRVGEHIGVPLSPRPCRKSRIGVGHTVGQVQSPPHRRPCPPPCSIPPTPGNGEDDVGPSKLAPTTEIRSRYILSLNLTRVVDRRVDDSGFMNP
jgi:hypothetical protein